MKRKGFTLVEIMIVVLVICLLAAVAIPNLSRARVSGQEANAGTNLNSVALAEIQYRALNGAFATLATLAGSNPPFIDSFLGGGAKQGYYYSVTMGVGTNTFWACAIHQQNQGHSFYVDQRGNLCRSKNPGETCPSTNMQGACTGLWAGLVEGGGGGATKVTPGGTLPGGGDPMGAE